MPKRQNKAPPKKANAGWTYSPRRDLEKTHDLYQAEVHSVNEAINAVDRKWGRGRLPLIVSYETRERFCLQFELYREACWSGSMEDVAKQSAGMRRAMEFMDKEATAAGVEVMPSRCVDGIKANGQRLVIVQDGETVLYDEDAEVWTADAVVSLIERHRPDLALKVLETFKGAKIEDYRQTEDYDDAPLLGV